MLAMIDFRKIKPTVEVTIKAGRKTYKLSLIPQPWKGRYWINNNGTPSNKMPESTISKLCEEIRKIIVKAEHETKL